MHKGPFQLFAAQDMEPGSYEVTSAPKHRFRVEETRLAVKEGDPVMIHREDGVIKKAVIIDMELFLDYYNPNGNRWVTVTAVETDEQP